MGGHRARTCGAWRTLERRALADRTLTGLSLVAVTTMAAVAAVTSVSAMPAMTAMPVAAMIAVTAMPYVDQP
jgi:hypothetical protein